MDKLVTLARYSNHHEVYIIQGLLATYGIDSYIYDELSATYLLPYTVGGIRLTVKESDLEKAKEIIAQEDFSQPDEG